MRKPRIGVSACLLGEEVRYDGGHKRNATLIDVLGPAFEFVPVCPEVEVGMSTPREPLQLVPDDRGVRMLTVHTGLDYTDRMHEWARTRIVELERAGIDGYVFKSGSPSCGLDVPVPGERIESNRRGLFSHAVMTSIPSLPVIDEKRLENANARDEFVRRVRDRHRGRSGEV